MARSGLVPRSSNQDLLVAASTIWVVVTAVLVIFMQAGFAFLEAGLTRMKNAGHIAGKNVLIFAIASLVYYCGRLRVGVRGRQRLCRHGRLLPVGRGADRRSGRRRLIGSRRSRARPATCSRSPSPVSRWRSSGGRWPSGRSSGSTSPSGSGSRSPIQRRLALDLVAARLAVQARHAGLRRLDRRPLPRRAGRAGRRADPRAADRQVRHRRPREPDPRPQHPLRRARDDHPLVRLVRLQPRLHPLGRLRRLRLLRLRRADHEHRRRRRRGHRHVRRLGQGSANPTSR